MVTNRRRMEHSFVFEFCESDEFPPGSIQHAMSVGRNCYDAWDHAKFTAGWESDSGMVAHALLQAIDTHLGDVQRGFDSSVHRDFGPAHMAAGGALAPAPAMELCPINMNSCSGDKLPEPTAVQGTVAVPAPAQAQPRTATEVFIPEYNMDSSCSSSSSGSTTTWTVAAPETASCSDDVPHSSVQVVTCPPVPGPAQHVGMSACDAGKDWASLEDDRCL